MRVKAAFAMAAAMLAGGGSASAQRPEVLVVAVRYEVREQAPERLVQVLSDPLERTLKELPGVTELNSAAGYGYVSVEVGFEGGANEKDVATVSRRIDELVLDSEVVVTSRTVRLAQARVAR